MVRIWTIITVAVLIITAALFIWMPDSQVKSSQTNNTITAINNLNNQQSKVINLASKRVEQAQDEVKEGRCPDIKRARKWARSKGNVAFNVICGGKSYGFNKGRHQFSASTGKALMLVAHLRRGQSVPSAKSTLSRMIKYSDNSAAHQIYGTLGDGPLKSTAKRAKMRNVVFCGCWSSIRWTPAAYSHLFYSLPDSLPKKYRWWAMGQLRNITPDQSWGIPQISRKRGYKTYFKGGWRPEGGGWIVMQGALLRRGDSKIALAIWTRNQPGLGAGAQKIKTVTRLLLPPARSR